MGKAARWAFTNRKSVCRSTAVSIKREQDPDFQHQRQSSQFCFMVKKLGALRKAFLTNYRHSSIAAYAGMLLKLRWPERISNKELWLAGNDQPRTYHLTNMQ
ncbi:unnamed protein product [Heterobilharzia americana]|nr:unnamed protein product [Heterobilharzia americana]